MGAELPSHDATSKFGNIAIGSVSRDACEFCINLGHSISPACFTILVNVLLTPAAVMHRSIQSAGMEN